MCILKLFLLFRTVYFASLVIDPRNKCKYYQNKHFIELKTKLCFCCFVFWFSFEVLHNIQNKNKKTTSISVREFV